MSIRVTLLLQLNGLLLKWKIQQIRQDTATEIAQRSFTHAQLKNIHLECSYEPDYETDISVNRAGPVLIENRRVRGEISVTRASPVNRGSTYERALRSSKVMFTLGARARLSLGTNVNTPLFKGPTPEYKVETLYSGTKVGVYILGIQCLNTAPFCAGPRH